MSLLEALKQVSPIKLIHRNKAIDKHERDENPAAIEQPLLSNLDLNHRKKPTPPKLTIIWVKEGDRLVSRWTTQD